MAAMALSIHRPPEKRCPAPTPSTTVPENLRKERREIPVAPLKRFFSFFPRMLSPRTFSATQPVLFMH